MDRRANPRLLETLVDTYEGRADRRYRVDDDFATLADAIGATDFVGSGGISTVRESVAEAILPTTAWTYTDEATYSRYQYLFPDDTDIPESGRTGTQSEQNRRARRQRRRRHVGATGGDVRADPPSAVPAKPLITRGAARDARTSTGTLRHEAGEPIAAARLGVQTGVAGGPVAPGDELTGRQFRDEYDRVGPGDGLEVRVGGTDTVCACGFGRTGATACCSVMIHRDLTG